MDTSEALNCLKSFNYTVTESLDTTAMINNFNIQSMSSLSALEKIKLDVAVAYTLASSFYALEKLNGYSTTRIDDDINKIKEYVQRIHKIEKVEKNHSEIDRAAASRLIQFELVKNNNTKPKYREIDLIQELHS